MDRSFPGTFVSGTVRSRTNTAIQIPDVAGVREDNMDRQLVVAHLVVVGVPIFGTYEQ